ncbi:hypothetical protein [Actinophytocola sp.]|uniref:hypothetical protein n=1 Tax=Actinophytocola sp. TaxID=1872138 RepID=UPI003D6A0234
MTTQPAGFPVQFDHRFLRLLSDGTGAERFGLDVLGGLVDGLADYRSLHDQSPPARSLGPALLGGFMWLDDDELIEAIASYPAACVVVSKQPAATDLRRRRKQATFDRLRQICDSRSGFPTRACPELADLAHRTNGVPTVIGPYTELPDLTVPTFRSIGPRKTGQHLVPILHTKMVLVGHLWWHDEGAAGQVEDVIGFTPQRLWLGSANGTRSSRRNLEFGVWLTDGTVLATARKFLTQVIRHSEDIDPTTDVFDPELAPIEFDDDAMAEAAAELWDDNDGA